MGTYVGSFTFFSASGGPVIYASVGPGFGGGVNSGNGLHDSVYWTDNSGDDAILNYVLLGNCFVLDGSSTPISIYGVPAGFLPITTSLRRKGTTNVSPGVVEIGSTQNISQITMDYGVFGHQVTSAVNAGIQQPIFTNFSATSTIQLTSILKFTLHQVRNHVPTDGALFEFVNDQIEIYGTYGISSFSFTLANGNGNKVRQNDQIRIVSTNGGISSISRINIVWIDSNFITNSLSITSFISQTDSLLTFNLYSGVPFDQLPPNGTNIIIEVVGNGIQFSGSFTIGYFVLISDSSGIYVITKNKRNDTLYDHNNTLVTEVVNIIELEDDIEDIVVIDPSQLTIQGLPEEESINNDLAFVPFTKTDVLIQTTDVKIPNPFIKGGFIGS